MASQICLKNGPLTYQLNYYGAFIITRVHVEYLVHITSHGVGHSKFDNIENFMLALALSTCTRTAAICLGSYSS